MYTKYTIGYGDVMRPSPMDGFRCKECVRMCCANTLCIGEDEKMKLNEMEKKIARFLTHRRSAHIGERKNGVCVSVCVCDV